MKEEYFRIGLALIAVTLVFGLTPLSARAQTTNYKIGDRVECDTIGDGKFWQKGTIVEFQKTDTDDGTWFPVKTDNDGVTYYCRLARIRPFKDASPAQEHNQRAAGNSSAPSTNNAASSGGNPIRQYKVGDRVECDRLQINVWEPGTVVPFQPTDRPNAGTIRVLMDHHARQGTYADGVHCRLEYMRPLASGKTAELPKLSVPIGKTTVDAHGTVSADRPILDCPVRQPKSRNGARPDPEVLKKVLRCAKGEKAAGKGLDGAVTVDVTGFELGGAIPWRPSRDIGDGRLGTVVYPAKVKYSVRTFNRTTVDVEDDLIKTVNFFVNPFGEWQIASEEVIKSAVFKSVPRNQ
jgi:hypothetical protein